MSVALALFLAVSSLLLTTIAECIVFTATAYSAGFRRGALKLLGERLRQLAPDRSQIKLESHVHARWDALIKLTQHVEHEAAHMQDRDRALAVLIGREADPEFLDFIAEARGFHQDMHLCKFSSALRDTNDLSHLILNAQSWMARSERRLRWLSLQAFSPEFFHNLYPRIREAVAHSAVAAVGITIVAASLISFSTHQVDIGTILTWTSLLLFVLGIAVVWLPLLIRAKRALIGAADPRMIRLAVISLAVATSLTVLDVVLLIRGDLDRFWLHGSLVFTRAVDDLHLSPAIWAVIGLFLVNALLLRPLLDTYRIAREARNVTWERVRAISRLAGWSSIIPATITLAASLTTGPSPDGFPQWVRTWMFTCLGVGFLLYLVSVAMRRRYVTSRG